MSALPARLEIADARGLPTIGFLSVWRSSGALVSLPAALVIVTPAGTITAPFFRLLRDAFPGIDLDAGARIAINRRPSLRLLAAWAGATA